MWKIKNNKQKPKKKITGILECVSNLLKSHKGYVITIITVEGKSHRILNFDLHDKFHSLSLFIFIAVVSFNEATLKKK